MIRRSSVIASVAAAALLLAACGNGGESDGNGVQELDPPEQDGGDAGADDDQDPADDPDVNGDQGDAEGDGEPESDPDADNGSEEDPFAVPDEIDIDYVQSVLDELTRADSEHLRSMLEREVPVESEESDHQTVDALYGGPQHDVRNQQMIDLFFSEDFREPYLPHQEMGGHRFEVMHLHEVNQSCVAAFGYWDISDVSSNPYEDDEFAAWVIHRVDTDDAINQTGWKFWDRTPLIDTNTGYRVPPDEWDEVDLGDSTDTSCDGS